MTITKTNSMLVERARQVIPGGVNSGNRVLPWPIAFLCAPKARICSMPMSVGILIITPPLVLSFWVITIRR